MKITNRIIKISLAEGRKTLRDEKSSISKG